MLRHPPDSEYWTRFITKRSQNPAKRQYNPGFYNPSQYLLGINPDPKSENEYWTRFVTKRTDPDKDYWTRFVKRENIQVLKSVYSKGSLISELSQGEKLSEIKPPFTHISSRY